MKEKSILKAIMTGVGIFVVVTLGGAFLTRDINRSVCILTGGDFKQMMSCRRGGEWSAPACDEIEDKSICVGGILDPLPKRKSRIFPEDEIKKSTTDPSDNHPSEPDPRGEYIYRVVGNARDGFEGYEDYEVNMHKYPEGIDFKTQEEASEYIFQQSGGRRAF